MLANRAADGKKCRALGLDNLDTAELPQISLNTLLEVSQVLSQREISHAIIVRLHERLGSNDLRHFSKTGAAVNWTKLLPWLRFLWRQ